HLEIQSRVRLCLDYFTELELDRVLALVYRVDRLRCDEQQRDDESEDGHREFHRQPPTGPRPLWAAAEYRGNESRPRAPTRTRRRSPLCGVPRRLLASPPQGTLGPPLGGGAGNSASTAP